MVAKKKIERINTLLNLTLGVVVNSHFLIMFVDRAKLKNYIEKHNICVYFSEYERLLPYVSEPLKSYIVDRLVFEKIFNSNKKVLLAMGDILYNLKQDHNSEWTVKYRHCYNNDMKCYTIWENVELDYHLNDHVTTFKFECEKNKHGKLLKCFLKDIKTH